MYTYIYIYIHICITTTTTNNNIDINTATCAADSSITIITLDSIIIPSGWGRGSKPFTSAASFSASSAEPVS